MSDRSREWRLNAYIDGNAVKTRVSGPRIEPNTRIRVIEYSAYDLALEEIACLRSVLSEFDQDKSCYIQMNRADELAESRKRNLD